MTDLIPSRSNLRAEQPPKRGTYPGIGGFFGGGDMIAVTPPAPDGPDALRAADDERKLALAPKADLDRLIDEQKQLTRAEERAKAALGAEERARQAVIDARVAGQDTAKVTQAYDQAVNAASIAEDALSIQKDVVDTLRTRILEAVRSKLTGEAQAKLDTARGRYDAALDRLAEFWSIHAELVAASVAEREAAAAFASGNGDLPGRSWRGDLSPLTGSRYVTVPEALRQIALMVVPDVGPSQRVTTAAELRTYLSRRDGLVPPLRPIDQEDAA